MRFSIAAVVLILSAGCGGSSVSVGVDDSVQDALEAVKECVREAIDSAQALIAPPPPTDDDGTILDTPAPLPPALGAVVKAAQDFVTAAAGKPIESDAKALLIAAQELETKGKSGVAPATIEQGLQALLSKISELRRRR